jgi:hypothetical protein
LRDWLLCAGVPIIDLISEPQPDACPGLSGRHESEDYTMTTRLASILCSIAMLLFQAAPALAGSSQTEITVTFAADTRDIHFRVAGHLTDGQDPRPTGLRETGGFRSETDNGAYNAGWDTAPGAATHVFTLKRSDSPPTANNGTGGWSGKWWLTTDGKLKSDPPANASTFASLYIDPTQSGIAVYAENGSGTSD